MKLFTPFTLKDITLKNRIVMAPMCMYESDDEGVAKPFHFVHYGARAYGGVSLVIQEATAVSRNGRISANDLGIWSNKHVSGLKKLVNIIHEGGAKAAIQLAHAGRKCTIKNTKIVAPSALAYSERYATPHALKIEEIQRIVLDFKHAAKRAKEAGYDVIEVHAAHGYLINQFLSPLTNKRIDIYGGSLRNRTRFLKEVLTAIRLEWDGPLVIRVSSEEYDKEGHTTNETIAVLNEVRSLIDAVNVSTGGVVPIVPEVYEGYQISYAAQIKKAGYTVIGGGFIRDPAYIEKIIEEEQVDLVFLGRELLLNPFFIQRVAKRNAHDFVIKAYKRSFD